MKTIDLRFRPNTPDAVEGLLSSPFFGEMVHYLKYPERAWSAPIGKIVEMMEEHEIIGVITGRDVEYTFPTTKNGNMGVAELVAKFPGRFIGMAGLDPHKGVAAIEELKRMVGDYGMKGVSIDPYIARLPINDKLFYPIYSRCAEMGLPIVVTTGPGTRVPATQMDHSDPVLMDEVARDFPELTVIMSHGGYPYIRQAIMVCHRNRNVFMELSEYETWPGAHEYVEAANTLIPDKIVFASAHPFYDSWKRQALYETLGFEPQVLANVLWNNAARIFGM